MTEQCVRKRVLCHGKSPRGSGWRVTLFCPKNRVAFEKCRFFLPRDGQGRRDVFVEWRGRVKNMLNTSTRFPRANYHHIIIIFSVVRCRICFAFSADTRRISTNMEKSIVARLLVPSMCVCMFPCIKTHSYPRRAFEYEYLAFLKKNI